MVTLASFLAWFSAGCSITSVALLFWIACADERARKREEARAAGERILRGLAIQREREIRERT